MTATATTLNDDNDVRRNDEDLDATRIKIQQGSKCNEDQDATSIKMQRGSRFNEDQNATDTFRGGSG